MIKVAYSYISIFLISFLILVIFNEIDGTPKPIVTDDYSYLLAADTFASGRITNPTHPQWQFFENAHILSKPSYMSKYQPGYGAVLALGKILFGNPFYGVLLATALFATAFYWLARSFSSNKVAFLGGGFILISFGFFSYWGRSFFGGASISAFATCLVLGSYFYGRKEGRLPNPIQFCIGCAILFFTRPYEGGSLVIAVCLCILWDIYKKIIVFKPYKYFLITAIISGFLVISFQLYYDYKITGDYLSLPYSIHVKQYMYAPIFWFGKLNTPDHLPSTKLLQNLHGLWEMMEYKKIVAMKFFNKLVYTSSRVLYTSIFFPFFLISLVFSVLMTKQDSFDRRLIFLILFCTLSSSFINWTANHYQFSIIVCSIIFIVRATVKVVEKIKSDPAISSFFIKNRRVIYCVIFLYMITGIALSFYQSEKIKDLQKLDKNSMKNWVLNKDDIIKELEKNGHQNLVFVRYKDYKKSGEEQAYEIPSLYDSTIAFVYNKSSDIDSNKTVFAHDLGDSENIKIINYYESIGQKRDVWILDITDLTSPYKIYKYQIYTGLSLAT